MDIWLFFFYRHLCYNETARYTVVYLAVSSTSSSVIVSQRKLSSNFEDLFFYALFYLFPHRIPCQIDLHDYVCYLRQKIMVFHCIAVSAVQVLNIINPVFLIVKSFIFYFPASSCRFYHFFYIFLCQLYACYPSESYCFFSPLLFFFS